jgi:hypothetical protein
MHPAACPNTAVSSHPKKSPRRSTKSELSGKDDENLLLECAGHPKTTVSAAATSLKLTHILEPSMR